MYKHVGCILTIPIVVTVLVKMLTFAVIKLVSFFMLQRAHAVIQNVWWWLNGTRAKIRESKQPLNYDISNHVLDIRLKHRFDPMMSRPSITNFVASHNRFAHPDEVLKDNITLYELSPTQAVFIECPENINVYDSTVASFAKEGQFYNGRRLHVLPIVSFYRLADRVGPPRAPIIFLGHTFRCGSTLLSQIMDHTEEIVSMSEPGPYGAVARACQDKVLIGKDLDRYIASGIGLLCKPVAKTTSAYFLKINATAISQMNRIRQVFPDSKLLFLYRDGIPVAESIIKISYKLPILRTIFIFGKTHKSFVRIFYETVTGLPAKDFDCDLKGDAQFALMIWVILCKQYLTARQQSWPISAIKYEDLIHDSEYTLEQVFKYCDLPVRYVDKALCGLAHDSQRHSVSSRKNLKMFASNLSLSSAALAEVQAFCDLQGVPRLPESCVLDGTISHREIRRKCIHVYLHVFNLSYIYDILTLSSLNLPLSSSSTTSRKLLSQFSTCSG